ncbi:MAG: hypothetical protein K9W44_04605 [Candidatus Lokiarchaeota archaeon]|nr:hypothetical protein [Candidatus Harpocratesius repetitus]
MDLRASGQLRGTFSEAIGQMELAHETSTTLNQQDTTPWDKLFHKFN